MFIRLVFLIFTSFIFGQYYNLNINQTGESHLIVVSSSAMEGLSIGDEIGIFDLNGVIETADAGQEPQYGEVLVGSGVYEGDQLNISAIMSVDLSDFGGPTLNGAVDGNSIIIKIINGGFEYETALEFGAGGEFGDLFTSVNNIDLLGDGVCVLDLDCTGVCGGDAILDECGECNGNGPEENYDCDGNCILDLDCAGVCGGGATEDCAGVCDGDTLIDDCGVCNGNGEDCTELLFGAVDSSFLEILINSPIEITSFEFHIESIAEFGLLGSGGLAEQYGFEVYSSFDYYQYRTIVTGYGGSIPAGSGLLTRLDYVCNYPGANEACIIDNSITINQSFSGDFIGGCALVGDIIDGCTDLSACNYNSYATVEDGSCEYAEENFDCDGNCLIDVDECGECGGDGSSCEVYIELEITTTLDAPIEDEEELEAFEEDFESYMETELGLPSGTVEVISVTFVETREVEVIIEFAVVLTEEELTDTDFDTETIQEEIEETVSEVEEEVSEGLPEFIEGCTNSDANNYDPEANVDDGSCEVDSGDTGGDDDAIDYCLDLHFGANLISFYALPEDASIGNVMSSLDGVVTAVIGEGQAASPSPNGGFLGNLNTITPNSGYWVKVSTGADLCLTEATAVDPSLLYDLHFGANLISFPYEGSVPLTDALPDEVEGLFTGFIGEGQAASPNPNGGWLGNLSSFQGGRGYWAKASQGLEFSYITDGSSRVGYEDAATPSEYVQSSEQSFYLISDILFSGDMQVEQGDMIRAYNDNVIVGSVEWDGINTMIPVMGNDGSDYSIAYCDMYSTPEFVLTKADTGVEYKIVGDIAAWESNEIFHVGNVYAALAVIPEYHAIANAYPNPFNPSTNITIELMEADHALLSIYNANGQEVSRVWSGLLSEGSHSFVWDASEQPSGIYFARLHIAGQVNSKKLMLVK